MYQRGTIHTTVHLIGRVVQALENFDMSKLSQYSHLYRAFGMHTASFIKPEGLLEFEIRILVPDSKRWESMKTPPRNGSIIGVHGVLLGYDSSAKRILLSLQDIDYIPQDDKSASLETSSTSSTVQRSTRKRPFASPLKRPPSALAPVVRLDEHSVKVASTSSSFYAKSLQLTNLSVERYYMPLVTSDKLHL